MWPSACGVMSSRSNSGRDSRFSRALNSCSDMMSRYAACAASPIEIPRLEGLERRLADDHSAEDSAPRHHENSSREASRDDRGRTRKGSLGENKSWEEKAIPNVRTYVQSGPEGREGAIWPCDSIGCRSRELKSFRKTSSPSSPTTKKGELCIR